MGLTILNQALIYTLTPNLMGVIQSESMISQAFQASLETHDSMSEHQQYDYHLAARLFLD